MLIMRKLYKPVDARTYEEYAFGPVPERVRCRYRCYLASEREILATATGICVKVAPKRIQMCVLPFVALYSKLIPYLRKRK